MDPTFPHQLAHSDNADSPSGMPPHCCSDNNLKFICEFKPGHTLGDEDFSVSIDCDPVSVILPAQCSVYQLRLRICMQVGINTEWSVVQKYTQ